MRFEVAQHLTAGTRHAGGRQHAQPVIMWDTKHRQYLSKPTAVTEPRCLQRQAFPSPVNSKKHFFLYHTVSASSNRCILQRAICIGVLLSHKMQNSFAPAWVTALPMAPCSGSREKYFQRATLHAHVGAENLVGRIPPKVSAVLHSVFTRFLFITWSLTGEFLSLKLTEKCPSCLQTTKETHVYSYVTSGFVKLISVYKCICHQSDVLCSRLSNGYSF